MRAGGEGLSDQVFPEEEERSGREGEGGTFQISYFLPLFLSSVYLCIYLSIYVSIYLSNNLSISLPFPRVKVNTRRELKTFLSRPGLMMFWSEATSADYVVRPSARPSEHQVVLPVVEMFQNFNKKIHNDTHVDIEHAT